MNQIIKTIIIKIAGFNIKIELYHEEQTFFRQKFLKMLNYYSPFFINSKKKPDFIIKVKGTPMVDFLIKKKGEIEKLYKISSVFYPNKKTVFINYFISQAEFEIIIKKILSEYLLVNNGFLIHGSACLFDNYVLIFLGQSGAGKSTITKILKPKMKILADDIFIIRKINDQIFFFQTPFHEKNWQFKRSLKPYLIKAFFILEKSKDTKLLVLKNKVKKLNYFLNQLLINKKTITKYETTIIKELVNKIPFYLLKFSLNKNKILEKLKILTTPPTSTGDT